MAVKEPSGYKGVIKETSWSVWPTWESCSWNGWEGKDITVEVYTKASSASLYLNDKLIATKDVNRSTEYKAVFTLPYQPGTLKAVAGNATTTLKTAGEAYAIRMTPDKKTLKADGEDLAFIILEIIDKNGNIVPEAAVPVDIEVSGAGTLLAAGSANLQDTEATTSSHVTTWKGRAMVVVRSTQQKGKINVTTKSKLKNANSLLQSRP
jgi:beta-galactosidase